MTLQELVGRLAIRNKPTVCDNQLFLHEPVFVLTADSHSAMVSVLNDTEIYDSGTTLVLPEDYLDNNWSDFGTVVNKACETKTQVLTLLLSMLGLTATEQELFRLSQVLTFKQLLSELTEVSDTDLDRFVCVQQDNSVTEPWESNDTMQGTTWSPKRNGFVRRG